MMDSRALLVMVRRDVWVGTQVSSSTSWSQKHRVKIPIDHQHKMLVLVSGCFGFIFVHWEEVVTRRPSAFMSKGSTNNFCF